MIAFFAKHPTAANLLMLVLCSMGLFSIGGIRRETFPDFQPREVQIRVPYPGGTAEDVEEGVLERVEDAIDGVRYVDEVRGDARENMGLVTVEMVEGGDWRAFKDEIDTAIAAIDDLPEQTEEPIVEELHTTDSVMTILVCGQMSPGDLKRYAEDLRDRMREVPGIRLVDVEGFSDHQLRVELSAEALVRHNLSPSDVAASIRRQSVETPAGIIEARDEEVLVRFDEKRTSVSELSNLVVVADDEGSQIRLADLGKVRDAFQIEEEKTVLFEFPSANENHGHHIERHPEADTSHVVARRAAVLQIKKTDAEDSLEVAAAVKAFLKEERLRHPAVDLIVTQDHSTLIADRLGLLITNGWQGMILVFAMMWLFFNFKLSAWVVASLPVSFLGAFFFLPQVDVTINMLSMVGLLLGIGILMDDGIVIAENIAAHHERGKSPMQSAVDGVAEVGGGVFSSFLTTVCMLGPLAFLSGNIGRVLEVVPIILLLVLAVSLVEAFMILPSHLGHSLRTEGRRNRVRMKIDAAFEWIKEQCLGRCIDSAVRYRYLWIGIVVAMFLVTLSLPAGGVIKFQALPELDGDSAVARVMMPQGTSLKRTESVVDHLVRSLREVHLRRTPEQPNREPLVRTIYARHNSNADAFEAGPHVVTLYADLLSGERRTIGLDELFEQWRDVAGTIPDAVAVNFTDPGLGPTGRNIEIRARGRDLETLRSATAQLRDWLQRFEGVNNLTADLRPGKREYRIRFRPGVLGVGLDGQRMAKQLRAAFQGEQAFEIQVGRNAYEIEVRFDSESQDAMSDLTGFRFTLPDGSQAPLASVATIEQTRGWSRIAHVDGVRTATLRGDVDSRRTNTAAVLAKLESDFLPTLQERFPDLRFELEGETAESSETAGSLVRGLLIGSIGIFVLLSFQFHSYVEPLIVMAAIPFALIGVIIGHLALGFPLTMPSMLGFVSLSGVVVNDSIILVLFLKQRRADGAEPMVAARQASRDRFRAILITSLTTMAGLIPLTFETSLQAIVLIPLAISIVFGMAASTVLVLLVIPCMYVCLDDFGWTTKIKRHA